MSVILGAAEDLLLAFALPFAFLSVILSPCEMPESPISQSAIDD
jgi:hypothetical protein